MCRSITLLLAVLFSAAVNAQIAGVKNIPGDYADLATAITALNTQGVGAGGVTLNLLANNPQTAPLGGYVVGGAGAALLTTASAANTVLLQGNGNTVTAAAGQASGALTDAVFKIIGADWVTLTGFTLIENAANTTTTSSSNNMTEWGIALLYATTTNGAQNVTLQGNTIDLNRTYQNTFGIYSNSVHSATAIGTAATATTGAGGNSNLKIYGNTITDVNIGIVVIGPTGADDFNDGIDVGGTSTATGNTISNYGTTGTFSTYTSVSGTVNGVLVRNAKSFNVSYNTIASSNGGTTAGTLRGVYVDAASNTAVGTFSQTINNNNISVRSGAATGALAGIFINSGSGTVSTTLAINNNDFNNSGYTVASSGAVNLLSNTSTVSSSSITGNTFTNLSINTTGNVTLLNNSYSAFAGSVKTVSNNRIVTGFSKTAAGGTLTCFADNAADASSAINTTTNNNFTNITVTGATTVNVISNTNGGSPTKNVSGNIVSNINAGTNAVVGINVNADGGTTTVSNNLVSNITGGGTITGIAFGNSGSGATTAGLNTVHTLTGTGAGIVTGISVAGGNRSIVRAKVYNLENSNASGTVTGISVAGSSSSNTATLQNNLIGDLRTPAANVANAINGISTSGNIAVNAYYNTVYLNATSSGALFGSNAISVTVSSAVNLVNNIFVNLSTATGAGISAAHRRSGTALSNFGSASNNNLYYAGIPSAAAVIFTDGTNADQTLADYKTRLAPIDNNAVSQLPPFVSTWGADAGFLHITPGSSTAVESGGISLAGITSDYDGEVRAGSAGYSGTGSAPDIGADEFDGTATGTACAAPANQATAFVAGTSTASTQAASFTAATGNPTGYLIVRSVGSFTGALVNGTTYTAGNAIGNGVVVNAGSSLSFTASGLAGNTAYTYTIFSYNSSGCIGGPVYNTTAPLTATASTCPITPSNVTVTNLASTSFRLNWTSSRGGGAVSPIAYTIDVATDANFIGTISGSPFAVTDTTTGAFTTMRFDVAGLSQTTQYSFRIKASGCNAAYSTIANVTTLGPPPANDDAAGAIALTIGGGCSGAPYSLVNATWGNNEAAPSCSGVPQSPAWFKFVTPASGAVRVSTDAGTGGTLTNTRIALFSATDPASYTTFNEISCDDDGGSTIADNSVLYATGLTAGTTYYVAVDRATAATVAGTFCITVDELGASMLSVSTSCPATVSPTGSNSAYMGWVPLLDASSRLIALARNPAGGSVSAYGVSQNINASGMVRSNAGVYYLDRNYLINNATATNVQVQFFFLNSELAALTAANGTTLATLAAARQTGTTCQANFATANGSTTLLPQTSNGTSGSVSWIQVTTPGFSNFYLQASSGGVLPARILTFSGSRQGSSNLLKWTVAQESDVQAYQIERSDNGRDWTAVGSVTSLGNTTTQRTYSFADNNVVGFKHQYRLRQVERTGAARLSNIVIISSVRAAALTVSGLFPNPVSTTLSILVEAPAKDNVTIQVVDAVGRMVKAQKAGVEPGSNTLGVDVNGLSQGAYIIRVISEAGSQTAIGKFVKE